MIRRSDDLQTVLFSSALGWMGVLLKGKRLYRLTFGHASRQEAWKDLARSGRISKPNPSGAPDLVARLQAYARGETVSFGDVPLDLEGYTAFQHRVLQACRRITRGSTQSYGELASRSGSPRAARAVGNCMAHNRIPLIIPCHRVLPGSGRIGSYSAPGGTRTKEKLLKLERR
jgi:methylated-DNA-[protein]-cysteine S-methyltransferase